MLVWAIAVFSARLWHCDDCSFWQSLPLSLKPVLSSPVLQCWRAGLAHVSLVGFSSLHYFMQTKRRPRQEAQKISFPVYAGPAALVRELPPVCCLMQLHVPCCLCSSARISRAVWQRPGGACWPQLHHQADPHLREAVPAGGRTRLSPDQGPAAVRQDFDTAVALGVGRQGAPQPGCCLHQSFI